MTDSAVRGLGFLSCILNDFFLYSLYTYIQHYYLPSGYNAKMPLQSLSTPRLPTSPVCLVEPHPQQERLGLRFRLRTALLRVLCS
jgi:hypothetical protein